MSGVLSMALFLAAMLILSAFFSGYETGFLSSNPVRIRRVAEENKDPRARRILRYYDHPDLLITSILVGNNLAVVAGSITLAITLNDLWATVVGVPLFLFFGEVLPKSLFRLHPTEFTLAGEPVMRWFNRLLAPVVLPLHRLTHALFPHLGVERSGAKRLFNSLEEMRALVDESVDRGSLDEEEQEMIHSVIDLQKIQAKDVMVPRIRVVALPVTASRGELMALFRQSGKTRIPLYEGSMDKIVGIASAFDLLTDPEPDNQDIRRLSRAVLHVPDTMKLDDLLETMRRERQHLVVVVDEYGGTDGIICIEDILEQIFGEIHDEYDEQRAQVRRIGPHAFLVDGATPLEECAEAVGLPLNDPEVSTVGGWVCHLAGRIPRRGEVIRSPFCLVTILEGSPTHVRLIRLETFPDAPREIPEGSSPPEPSRHP
ncbi:MAG TPA: hemolysin family protein [Candidatus Hydrogenedentes bacterium]|nr:hemolysin family protein [Candidatus Hydrogenedentota bacterium]HOV61969.1 hemolysin family protein [Candidatus Hydrogenedentota bacterium]